MEQINEIVKKIINNNINKKNKMIEIIKYNKMVETSETKLGKYKYYTENEILKIKKYLNNNNYNKIEYNLSKFRYKDLSKQLKIIKNNNPIIEYKINTIDNYELINDNFIILSCTESNIILTKFPNIIKYTEIINCVVEEYINSFITIQLITNRKNKVIVKIIINIDYYNKLQMSNELENILEIIKEI